MAQSTQEKTENLTLEIQKQMELIHNLRVQLMEHETRLKQLKYQLSTTKKDHDTLNEAEIFKLFMVHLRDNPHFYFNDRGNIDANKALYQLKFITDSSYGIEITSNLVTKLLKKGGIIHPRDKKRQTTIDKEPYYYYEIDEKRGISFIDLSDRTLDIITKDHDTYALLPYKREITREHILGKVTVF